MKMNRRNVLIGIGTVAVGSGVALGSGAFTQVEANRTVNLNVSDDDSGALLELTPLANSEIVGDENSGTGANVLRLEQTNLNDNATTTVAGGITVTNNGGQDVGFYIQDDGAWIGDGNELDFEDDSSGDSVVGTTNSVTLSANGGSVTLDVVIDLTGSKDVSNVGGDVTFIADVDQA
jgi:hypothetical protein